MNIKQALESALKKLEERGVATLRLDAYLLMAYALGKDKSFIFAHPDYELTDEEDKLFSSFVSRRAEHEPTAYITGFKEFYGLDFKVDKNVLIPRPDTELTVDMALEEIKKRGDKKTALLDLCCGSGCIGISVLQNAPGAYGVFSDISGEALKICAENIALNKTEERSRVIKSDLFAELETMRFDMILTNPPYVSENEYETLSPDIINYEPKTALTADENGLAFYRRIANEAANYLNGGGCIIAETGCNQSKEVYNLFKEAGFEDISVHKDLAGLYRTVKAYKKTEV